MKTAFALFALVLGLICASDADAGCRGRFHIFHRRHHSSCEGGGSCQAPAQSSCPCGPSCPCPQGPNCPPACPGGVCPGGKCAEGPKLGAVYTCVSADPDQATFQEDNTLASVTLPGSYECGARYKYDYPRQAPELLGPPTPYYPVTAYRVCGPNGCR